MSRKRETVIKICVIIILTYNTKEAVVMAQSEAMKVLIVKYAEQRRKYSLELEKRDMAEVVREFNMLLIKLESGIPDGASDSIAAQIMAERNNNIDEFIKYLQAKKY